MAATIIIYAGAIIVTFLFVLMLSQRTARPTRTTAAASRSRQPRRVRVRRAGAVHAVSDEPRAAPPTADRRRRKSRLLAPVLTADERTTLADVVDAARRGRRSYSTATSARRARNDRVEAFENVDLPIKNDRPSRRRSAEVRRGTHRATARSGVRLGEVARYGQRRRSAVPRRPAGPRRPETGRDRPRSQRRALRDIERASLTRSTATRPRRGEGRGAEAPRRGRAARGAGELPARNVRNLGLVLYTEHLLAVELAGTLLLVATIGAIAIAHRKGVAT